MAARIVAHAMRMDQERALDQERVDARPHLRRTQERGVWNRGEKLRMAVERAEDSLKGTHAGVPTTAQMPLIRL